VPLRPAARLAECGQRAWLTHPPPACTAGHMQENIFKLFEEAGLKVSAAVGLWRRSTAGSCGGEWDV